MTAVARTVLTVLVTVACLSFTAQASAQGVRLTSVTVGNSTESTKRALDAGAHLGPAIESHGAVFDFEGRELMESDAPLKLVLDAFLGAEPGGVNFAIDSAARFLNMHVATGTPRENVEVAVVLHGPATAAALSNEAYRARFGVDNPNLALIKALAEAGVPTYVCVQAATGAGVIDDIEAPARLVISALTALVRLQADGYQRVSW